MYQQVNERYSREIHGRYSRLYKILKDLECYLEDFKFGMTGTHVKMLEILFHLFSPVKVTYNIENGLESRKKLEPWR